MKKIIKLVDEENFSKELWITIDGDDVEVQYVKIGGPKGYRLIGTNFYKIK